MKKITIGGQVLEIGKFYPHLIYSPSLDCFTVLLKDCSILEERVTGVLDLLWNNNQKSKSDDLVGFNLWRPQRVLGEMEYKKNCITLEHLIERLDKHIWLPYGRSCLGEHKIQLLKIVEKHQFVWWIPPHLLLK